MALANTGLLGCPSCSGSAAALHHLGKQLEAGEDSASLLEEGAIARLPDLVLAESKIYDESLEPMESYLAITLQVSIPFLIAGFGMVGAGLVLDLVQVGIQILFHYNLMPYIILLFYLALFMFQLISNISVLGSI